MVTYTDYSKKGEEAVLDRASSLTGKSFQSISKLSPYPKDELNKKNKGNAGNFIEHHWFGIKNNSSPNPDFESSGIELKVCPLITRKTKGDVVKENTKACSINYFELIGEEWETSHFKSKMKKVLFVFYKHNSESFLSQKVLDVALWNLYNDEGVIKIDWTKARDMVREGKAHELSMSNHKVMGPNTSGTGKMKPQPVTTYQTTAKERSFMLKRGFVDQFWQSLKYPEKYESIYDTLNLTVNDDFELELLKRVNKYKGKTIEEVASFLKFNVPKSKGATPIVLRKAIGFNKESSRIKEFDQLGIGFKTIPVREDDLRPFESTSFPIIKLKELESEQDWESSALSEHLSRILFLPVIRTTRETPVSQGKLGKAFFWSPSPEELTIIKKEWMVYRNDVIAGKAKTRRVKAKNVTSLSKQSDTEIIHMRPHSTKGAKKDIDSHGNMITKHCFWLNQGFIQKLLIDSQ
jgi:DNA mismatch repair endonuclease MutH